MEDTKKLDILLAYLDGMIGSSEYFISFNIEGYRKFLKAHEINYSKK